MILRIVIPYIIRLRFSCNRYAAIDTRLTILTRLTKTYKTYKDLQDLQDLSPSTYVEPNASGLEYTQ